jgi:hypothetical protein
LLEAITIGAALLAAFLLLPTLLIEIEGEAERARRSSGTSGLAGEAS